MPKRWMATGCGGPQVPSFPRERKPVVFARYSSECEGCGGPIEPGDGLYRINKTEPLQCVSCACWEERR